jgi:hypothetical protein
MFRVIPVDLKLGEKGRRQNWMLQAKDCMKSLGPFLAGDSPEQKNRLLSAGGFCPAS